MYSKKEINIYVSVISFTKFCLKNIKSQYFTQKKSNPKGSERPCIPGKAKGPGAEYQFEFQVRVNALHASLSEEISRLGEMLVK